MKPIYLIIINLLISFIGNAEITKGNWLVGGTGTLYAYNQDWVLPSSSVQYKYTNIDISA